jgi:hypothetical protein
MLKFAVSMGVVSPLTHRIARAPLHEVTAEDTAGVGELMAKI